MEPVNEVQLRTNAAMQEFMNQISILLNRNAQLAADLATANAKITELSKLPEEKKDDSNKG